MKTIKPCESCNALTINEKCKPCRKNGKAKTVYLDDYFDLHHRLLAPSHKVSSW